MAARSASLWLAAAAVALSPVAAAQAVASALPDGWERPTNADLAGPNLEFRKNKPGRYLVAEGDFDGDGAPDRAEILVNRFSRTYALYAFISRSPSPIELVDGHVKEVEHVGISAAKPGRVRTACGKGYDGADPQCKHGVPFVDIPFQSIEYFGFETGGSQFYWTGDSFRRVRTSD